MLKKLLITIFISLGLLALALALMLTLPIPAAPNVGKMGNFAVVGVNIVDLRTGDIDESMTLTVYSGRIVDIRPSDAKPYCRDAMKIDGRGMYMIPGLWDMHTHSYKFSPQLHHPLLVANGVTHVRDMSGCLDRDDSYWACISDRQRWSEQAESGERVSPWYALQSSYQTNGGNEVPEGFPSFFKLQHASDAAALAGFYQAAGADFIKTYSELTNAQYQALAAEAAAHSLYLAGHKPLRVPLETALDVSQKSIEHARLFLFECYSDIAKFRALDDPIAAYTPAFMWQMLEQQDDQRCAGLMQRMAASDSWWVPTLTTLKMSAAARHPVFRQDARLEQIPYVIKQLFWYPDADRAARSYPAENKEFVHQAFFDAASAQVGAAHRQGVKLLAGTDAGDTYVFYGSSLHEELAMLVAAGLSPFEALQAATLQAARFSELDQHYGTLEVDKVADFVLLEGNPLQDIENLRNIRGVMQGVVYYDHAALQELKEFAISQAGSLRMTVQVLAAALRSPLMRRQIAD